MWGKLEEVWAFMFYKHAKDDIRALGKIVWFFFFVCLLNLILVIAFKIKSLNGSVCCSEHFDCGYDEHTKTW